METAELSRDDPAPCNGSAKKRSCGWLDRLLRISSSMGISDVNSDDDEEESPRGSPSGAEDDDDSHFSDTEEVFSPAPLVPAVYDMLTEYIFPQSSESHPCHTSGKSPAQQTPRDSEDGEGVTKTTSGLMKKFPWVHLLLKNQSDQAEAPLEVVDA
jgi:hypothetical protein